MDKVAQHIQAFQSFRGPSATAWKQDVLLDLCALHDRRVVAFLVTVLVDIDEAIEVRVDVLNRLRGFQLKVVERVLVANSLIALLEASVDPRLRLHATAALGDFSDVPHVLDPLGSLVLSQSESFELRYAAFGAIERAGPTPHSIALLENLAADELLGRVAANILKTWPRG